MYDELVNTLRQQCVDMDCGNCNTCVKRKAADAIEELQQTVEHYKGCSDDWYREACDYKAICEQMKATVICLFLDLHTTERSSHL